MTIIFTAENYAFGPIGKLLNEEAIHSPLQEVLLQNNIILLRSWKSCVNIF